MTRATIALVLLALAWPAMAHAQAPQTNAPPGNSAVDEYLETVPGATGNQRPRTPTQGGASEACSRAAERARLERLGPDGKTLADAVDATARRQAGGRHDTLARGHRRRRPPASCSTPSRATTAAVAGWASSCRRS